MTKEELEKEAIAKYKTGSYPQLHPDRYAFIHGYLAAAKPREKRVAELKEKLTAIRNAKDKYDMSNDKSIIKAFGAEYTLFCDLERILEDWQEDEQLTKAKGMSAEEMGTSHKHKTRAERRK